MSDPINVAVIYYSATGTIYELARNIADGARAQGAEVRLLKVAELAARETVATNPVWEEHVARTEHVPVATANDMIWADAIILGTPTRFGNVAAPLKQFIDSLGKLWFENALADKIFSGFTASSTRHGGQESTLLALYNTVHHFGGIIVSPGYTDPLKLVDGNPYGTSHVNDHGSAPVDDVARRAAAYQGKRVATLAAALKAGQEIDSSSRQVH